MTCGDGRAETILLPVPSITIYPRDVITDGMLEDREIAFRPLSGGALVASRDDLVGKVARQTLLPGAPVPVHAVEEPRLVDIGRQVKLVFSEGGVTIVTSGQALQPGRVGDLVRARNLDSGATIAGIVQADGSIRVGDF
jgi:flagella basal body P-ring formation protein FlgA